MLGSRFGGAAGDLGLRSGFSGLGLRVFLPSGDLDLVLLFSRGFWVGAGDFDLVLDDFSVEFDRFFRFSTGDFECSS